MNSMYMYTLVPGRLLRPIGTNWKDFPRYNGYSSGRLFVCCILFLFYIQQIEAQKDKYGFIMDKVRERVYENYDSMMYTYSNYAEYAYIDSSKELLGTLYNGIDCFLLKAITQSMFVFDGRSDKHFEDKYLNKKRMTGNWDTCYQRTVVTDIVNKTDYAVLLFSRSADCFRIVGSQDR